MIAPISESDYTGRKPTAANLEFYHTYERTESWDLRKPLGRYTLNRVSTADDVRSFVAMQISAALRRNPRAEVLFVKNAVEFGSLAYYQIRAQAWLAERHESRIRLLAEAGL